MADLSITAANVKPVSGSTVLADGVCGEAITKPLMPLYLHTDGKYYMAIDDTALHAAVVAVSMHITSAADQPCRVAISGQVDAGAIFAQGQGYCVSDTAGGIALFSERGTGDFVTWVLFALSTSRAQLMFVPTAVQL